MNPSEVYYLTLEDMQSIGYYLVKDLLQFEEPVPIFETRFPDKLESVLEISKQGEILDLSVYICGV